MGHQEILEIFEQKEFEAEEIQGRLGPVVFLDHQEHLQQVYIEIALHVHKIKVQ